MSDNGPVQLNAPDAGSRGPGEMLRLAREAQGISLDHLASILKVTPAKLEALEQGRLDQLPDPAFARALAQTICRTLKIDPVPVLAGLPSALPAGLGHDKPAPLNQPFKETRLAPQIFDRGEGSKLAVWLTPKYLAPVALLLAAAVVYLLPDSVQLPAWVQELRQPSEAASAASAADAASDVSSAALPSMDMASVPDATASDAASAVDGAASMASSVAAAASVAPAAPAVPPAVSPLGGAASLPVATQAAGATASLVAATVQGGATANATDAGGAVVLQVSEDAWIEVVDGQGNKRLSRVVRAGETLAMGGVAPWNVRIGNASGVKVTLRGEPIELASFTRNNVARLELK